MKKLAYIYDHRFYRKGDKIFSSGAFTYNVWSRFLKGFDEVTIFGTLIPASEKDVTNLNRVDGPNVNFEHVPYISNAFEYAKSLLFSNKILSERIPYYDAVITRLPGRYSSNAFWIAERNDISVGVEVVGCPWDAYWNYGSLKGKLMAPVTYARQKKILKNASHAVYVTEYFLQSRYPTSGNYTHASNVDIDIPPQVILQDKIKQLCNNRNEVKIGLMGSSDVKYKGHYELLKAVGKIKNKLPELSIEFIGPGDTDWVQKLAIDLGVEKLIKIRGKIPSGKPVMKWLDSLDVYVHPSKQEGLPRSVIEAMSRACPVLASSVGGIPELLADKYMHNPGDHKNLAIQLKTYITDTEQLIEMAKENYERSKEYDSSILEERRREFWNNFAKQI